MRILIVSYELWDGVTNGGNVLSNIFEGYDAEFAQIFCVSGTPYNKVCKRYFQITDQMVMRRERMGKELIFEDYPANIEGANPRGDKRKTITYFRSSLMLLREMAWGVSKWKTKELEKFILDFSVMNDFSYYNGLVFQGFVDGVPKTVLSGGRYDNLVKRFGCDTSAAGFAVYTDLLSRYFYGADDFDGDVLLVYANDCNPCDVLKAQEEITNGGESCVAVTIEPLNKKYKRKLTMLSDGSLKNE